VRAQNILSALCHKFRDLIAEAELDAQNWCEEQDEWGIDVIGKLVRKVYLLLLP
jgi:lipopolysaccharide/colanic/teichoic acid biosynthesis glycosyltransferase